MHNGVNKAKGQSKNAYLVQTENTKHERKATKNGAEHKTGKNKDT
jgi:hypothetical protein